MPFLLRLAVCDGTDVGLSLVMFSWFRGQFCEPSSTADFECTVPFSDNVTETEWCLDNFNATNCASIRNSAQNVRHFLMMSLLDKKVWYSGRAISLMIFIT